MCEISHSCYTSRIEELDSLCNAIESSAGIVQQDIEKMKELTKKPNEIERTIKKQIVNGDLVRDSLEIVPSTDYLKPDKPSESKKYSGSNQSFLSKERTLVTEKSRERLAAVKSIPKETIPVPPFEPLIFTKQSFKKSPS